MGIRLWWMALASVAVGCQNSPGEEPGGGGGQGGVQMDATLNDMGDTGVLDGAVGGTGGAEPPPPCVDPGRVTLRRLNRTEYDNTLRDLLGEPGRPGAERLPDDNVGYGFDTIADVLSISPLHIEGWESIGQTVVEFTLAAAVDSTVQTFEGEDLFSDVGRAGEDSWNLWSNGELPAEVTLPADGEYLFRAGVLGQQAGPDPVQMSMSFDGRLVAQVDVLGERNDPVEVFEYRIQATAGVHTFAVAFLNDYHMPDDPDPSQRDRNLHVDYIEVEGPFGAASADPERRALVMVCEPAADDDVQCARTVVETFAHRAWRRPLDPDEVDRLMTLVQLALDEGDDVNQGIQLAVRAILLSPWFVYRVELDADPSDATPHRLNDHELATRLSYFLWASTPDAQLLATADGGSLSDPAVLAGEVDRMLADPKAASLSENFGDQWLNTRAMVAVDPEYSLFPDFDEDLRSAMMIESRVFFRSALAENWRLPQLMTAPTVFLNARLADHYGLEIGNAPPVPGVEGFFAVPLPPGSERVGLLTLGSLLSVTSYRTRTSPVRRGKWVLEQILCAAPPPPPGNVELNLDAIDPTLSMRERMAIHREDPSCAGCHVLMDPIGLGMENFDAVGHFRTMENDLPVDASGDLPGSGPFSGIAELSGIMRDDPRLSRCFTRTLSTYAVGRGMERVDQCQLDAIQGVFDADDAHLKTLIQSLVGSPIFTHRRGEAEQ